MKIRKIMTGMAAGMMAVSSAIVCQITAGAVDTTLFSDTAVASWNNLEVDLRKAGIADENSSLVISCPIPDGVEDGNLLFRVILKDEDWEDPTYSLSYDANKTEFSLTVPGSELTGKTDLIIQAGQVDVKLTVKAVGFTEDTRAAINTGDVKKSYCIYPWNDENGGLHFGGKCSIDSVDGITLGKTTVAELKGSYKSLYTSGITYLRDSANIGKDNLGYNYCLQLRSADGNYDEVYFDGTNYGSELVAYPDDIDSSYDSYTITAVSYDCYVQDGYDVSGLSGEKSIRIFANELGKSVTAPELPIQFTMNAYSGDWINGCLADRYIEITDMFEAETVNDLLTNYGTFTIPAGEYFSDSLGLGADGFEVSLDFQAQSNGEEQHGRIDEYLSYADGGTLYFDDSSYDGPSYDDKLEKVFFVFRPKQEYNEELGKMQAVSEKVRNLKDGDPITVQTREDKRATLDITPDLPTNIIMYANYNDDTNGASIRCEIDVSDQFQVKTIEELVNTLKGVNLPAGGYVSDSLGLGADGFEMRLSICGTDADGNEFWGCSNELVSYADGGFISTDIYYPGSSSDTIKQMAVTIQPKYVFADNGKSQAVSEKVMNLNDGDALYLQTKEDTRRDITVTTHTGGIVLYCTQDPEWMEGTVAYGDYPVSSVSGITIGKTTIAELKSTVKTISASTKPVYKKDSLGVGKDAFNYAIWMHLKKGSDEQWTRGPDTSFDEIATFYTDSFDDSWLDDYVIEEIGVTFTPKFESLPNGKHRAANETIRNLDPDSRIYINDMDVVEDDEDDIKFDGLGEVKEKGTKVFGKAEWDPEQLDINIAAIDPSWIKTEDDVIIIKMKYNKEYYDEWASLVITKNDGDYSEGFAYQFAERDFNIHIRAGELMKYWNCKTVKELGEKNLAVQLWSPELGDSVDYQITVISPKFEGKVEDPKSKPKDFVPPTIKEPERNKTNSQVTGVKPSPKDPNKNVYDSRFVMSVSSNDVFRRGVKIVAYITIKRLDTNQVATITTSICYDQVSAIGDPITAGAGEKLLAFALINIPEGVSIEYTSIILSIAEE